MKNITTFLTLAALTFTAIKPVQAAYGSSNLEAFNKKYAQQDPVAEEPEQVVYVSLVTEQPAPKANAEKSLNAKELLRRELSRSITCPSFITENSELNVVKALVSVSDEGAVTIYEINTGNPKLKQYVQHTLQTVKVENPGYNERFVLVINFRVE